MNRGHPPHFRRWRVVTIQSPGDCMIGNGEAAGASDRDDREWDGGESVDLEPTEIGPTDPDDEIIVASDDDLYELDAAIEPDFVGAWEVTDLDLPDETDDEDDDDEFDDEILQLHELGIDLDAPDGVAALEMALDLDPDEQSDDGVAA
jgi:hypothetical protein